METIIYCKLNNVCNIIFVVVYSNERLDMIDKREQFLKNTFESLGGSEPDFQDNKYNFPSEFN